MIKAILFLLFVAPLLVILKLALTLLGIPMVALGLLKAEEADPKPYASRHVDDPWSFVVLKPDWINKVWGSDKYGARGNWFWNDHQDTNKFWPRFNWLALRNPVSNLENLFPFYELHDVVNDEIKYIGDEAVFDFSGGEGIQLAWYGWAAGFHYVKQWGKSNHCIRIRYGFKFQPNEKGKVSSPSLTFLIAPFSEFN